MSASIEADMKAGEAYETVSVALGDRSYDILIGSGLIASAAAHIRPALKRPRAVVLTDEHVAVHHLAPLQASLEAGGIEVHAIVLPAGEATKSFEALGPLMSRLLQLRLERADRLIALGGGVIGDLTGFAAAILLRGVDFIQIPTTLLAQVDSSVGGKTGINTPEGKNLVGAFHQPRLVLADTQALATLPRRQFLAGYAEIVKYGLIDDAAFFDWLDDHLDALMAGEDATLRRAIVVSCEAKARIVAQDEREGGLRALLNLGHTFGHALEAATGFSDRLLHGEGVALGMCLAFDLSVEMGLCPPDDAARVRAHLARSGLPTRLADVPGALPGADDLIALMATDKKVADGKLTFILARGIGQSFITRDVDRAQLARVLAAEEAA